MEVFMSESRPRSSPPRVVILTAVYNEEDALPLYEQAVSEVLLSRPDYDFRVLFIDDGSQDISWEIIREICKRDPRFEGIRLSRNFGSHTALCAGFAEAQGDAVTILACDLQDPPEVILEFLEKWETGVHIVWGRRRTRKDKFWRILTSNVFYQLMRRFAMPHGSQFTTGSFFLVDRRVAECMRQFQERSRITFALAAWTGFEQAPVDYDRRQRVSGVSGWNFSQMLKTMYDAFIGFSFLPVRLITLVGVVAFLLTLVLAAYLFYSWSTGNPVLGWTSQMMTMALFFGVQCFLMGIVGEYLYRIYAEVVRRPLYFISEQVKSSQHPDENDPVTFEESGSHSEVKTSRGH
jgi:dolichol-phosphate mannosyltransferase